MVNLLAVLVLGIVGTFFGMWWYGPLLFGRQWSKLARIRARDLQEGAQPHHYALGFLAVIVMVLVLSFIVDFAGVYTFGEGVLIGVLVWIGFILTSILQPVLWERMPLRLYIIHVLHYGIFLAFSGGILAIW